MIFKYIIKFVDYIIVRDYDFFDLLYRLKFKNKVDLLVDFVFLMSFCCEKKVEKLLEKYNIDFSKKIIGIVVRKWKKEKDMIDKIV